MFDESQKFSSDGRGAITIQLHRRVVFYPSSEIPPSCSDNIAKLTDFSKIKVDSIDLSDIPPVLAELLVRCPGRNYKFDNVHWVARFCGHITTYGNPSALCEFCIVSNALWSDFTFHSFHEHKPWVKAHLQKYYPECVDNPKFLKKITRLFCDKLNGNSRICATVTHLPNELEDTVRERHLILRCAQMRKMEEAVLHIQSMSRAQSDEVNEETQKLKGLVDEIDVMNQNLQFLSSMTTDTRTQDRIERFKRDCAADLASSRIFIRLSKDLELIPEVLQNLHEINARYFLRQHKESAYIEPVPIPSHLRRTSDLSVVYADEGISRLQASQESVHEQEVPSHILDAQRLYWVNKQNARVKKQPGRHKMPYKDQPGTCKLC